ncbi:MAG: V-type ATP synthase subunit E [Candidatus Hydrogenedentes bacterium]|nr:V-type ATP synthase subunit E [Candidatus Hydrogenedentota bacterium]
MALDKIQQAVKSSAQAEAERVLEAARQAAQERVAAEQEAVAREAERQYQAATRAIDEEFARKLLQVKGAAGKQLLAKRNELLARIFHEARQQILTGDASQYAEVMRRLLDCAAGGLGGKLRIHPSERAVFAGILASFNAGRDRSKQLVVDETKPLAEPGGFIFVGGAFEVDQTLDTLLKDMEYELAPRIAAELFQD